MLKNIIKKLFYIFGLDVHRFRTPKITIKKNPFDKQKEIMDLMRIEKPCIFDIGANKGQTVKEYKARFSKSKIFCFEPFPDAIKVLKENYKNDDSINIIPYAVSAQASSQTFYINPNYDQVNSLLKRNQSSRRYYPENAELISSIQVETITIDDYLNNNDIDNIDIMKFDIQGGELMALQGAIGTLSQNKISLIYIEVHFIAHYEDCPLFYQLCDFLADYKYTLFDIYDLRMGKNGQLRWGDALFVSENIRKEVIDRYPEEP